MNRARPTNAPARRHPLVGAPPKPTLSAARGARKATLTKTILSPRLRRDSSGSGMSPAEWWGQRKMRVFREWRICVSRLAEQFYVPLRATHIQLKVSNRPMRGALKISWGKPLGEMTLEQYLTLPTPMRGGWLGDPWIDDDEDETVTLAMSMEAQKIKVFPTDFDLWVVVYYWS